MGNYVRSILKPNSNIFLIGEAPGEDEDRLGVPFVGRAGKLLNQLLEQAGINRAEVSIANVAREKPPGNKISFFFEDTRCTTPKPILSRWLEELRQEILQVKPNIVVTLGATAMWALLGEKGLQEHRGYIQHSSLIPGQKTLTTWHPQKVGYEWKLAFETIMDLRKAKNNSLTPQIAPDMRALNAYPSTKDFLEYLRYLIHDHKEPVALDIETPEDSHIDILGLADSSIHAVSYNLFTANKQPRLTPQQEQELWYLFAKVCQKRELIMQNGMYDATVLMHHNAIFASGYKYDTMIAAHCCWPEARRSLAFLSSICLNVPKWKHQSHSAPTLYNAADAANTYGVWETLEPEMEKLGVRSTFDFEMMQVWPSMMMQLQGLGVNKERQREMISSINQRIIELQNEIKNDTGKEINLNSHQQLKTLLYIDMKLPIQYKRRKSRHDDRKMTVDNEAMRKLKRIADNPLLDKIMEYKKLTKLLTFIDVQSSPEGKVHTSYNVTGATMAREHKGTVVDDDDSYKSFGRWSSSKSIIIPYGSGNLQNIPKAARKMYIPPDNLLWLQADYKQAEAVVVSYEILDTQMIKLFKASFGLTSKECAERNLDIHKLTAAKNFQIPIAKVTPELRDIGKTIRHATNYSAGPGVVASRLGCTINQAKQLLRRP